MTVNIGMADTTHIRPQHEVLPTSVNDKEQEVLLSVTSLQLSTNLVAKIPPHHEEAG